MSSWDASWGTSFEVPSWCPELRSAVVGQHFGVLDTSFVVGHFVKDVVSAAVVDVVSKTGCVRAGSKICPGPRQFRRDRGGKGGHTSFVVETNRDRGGVKDGRRTRGRNQYYSLRRCYVVFLFLMRRSDVGC